MLCHPPGAAAVQVLVSLAAPTHPVAHGEDALLHVRVRDCVPWPQVAEQAHQPVHAPHWLATGTKEKI